MIFTANADASPVNYGSLKSQFDRVLDDFDRVAARERIEARVLVEDLMDLDDFVLVHPNYDIPTPVALEEIANRELVPNTFEELLAYAKKFPGKQREFPVVALGEALVIDRERRAPYLTGGDGKRLLFADRFRRVWRSPCRFLARRVRK